MNVVYCSLILPKEKNIIEKVKNHLSNVSLSKFTNALISGLDFNLDMPPKVFNIINVLNYPKYKQFLFKTEKWNHVYNSNDVHIGYINVFGLKYITQQINLYHHLDNYIKSLKGQKCIICVHHTYYPFLKVATKLKKKYKNQILTCLITGDVPGKFGLKSQFKNNIKQKMIDIMEKSIFKMSQKFDTYIFQTKYMHEAFNIYNKPICVVECAFLPDQFVTVKNKNYYNPNNKKIVFYAGSVREEYGIIHLINSFKYINDNDFEFWIAGGNATEKIKNMFLLDKRIKYLGFISPQEVYDRQQASTVLISPRKSNETFVKYSFPSKTMECLASGIPYIAHKLPCEPDEYKYYIQYPENETDIALAKKIIEICNLSDDERCAIGRKAKDFIINNKNPNVVCKKIVDFWKRELEYAR